MTKDKERDDAMIAKANENWQAAGVPLPYPDWLAREVLHLERSNWQPAPKPDRAEEKSVDTSFQGNRSPTHRCKVCGALWILYSDAWSLCSKECGKCCNNVLMGEQIEPLLHSDLVTWMELPSNMPEPDRAEVLAGEVISAANIVSHGGYYELDEEAVTTIIRRHFDELRAEIEAERPAVVVPMSAKMWAESVLNLRGAINATCEREAARFIKSLDGVKGDE